MSVHQVSGVAPVHLGIVPAPGLHPGKVPGRRGSRLPPCLHSHHTIHLRHV